MKEILLTGIDVGSTTTKIAAINPENGKVVYSDYRRHQAALVHSVYDALETTGKSLPTYKNQTGAHGFRSKTSLRETACTVYSGSGCQFHGIKRAVSSCQNSLSWADRMQK